MRLKEIKPGMVIRCENDKEKAILLEELDKLGYVWEGGKPIKQICPVSNTIHVYEPSCSAGYKYITYSDKDGNIKFSDLIIPELSAEEVLKICHKICDGSRCSECLMFGNCFIMANSDFKEIVKICEQWKADHTEKEPEVEKDTTTEITKTYEDGLNDAWELVKRIFLGEEDGGLDYKVFLNIFGEETSAESVLENFTPQEVLAMIEAYEKEQEEIKVGDVVERVVMGIFVVTNVNTDTHDFTLMNKEGRATFARRNQIRKTGKHIELSSILAKIGKGVGHGEIDR